METLGVHQNIPASNTKLTHGLGIYSIGPPLVMDKLIPVISRAITSPPEMGAMLDVECKPAVIIKPRFILVTHTDTLVRGTKRSTSRDKCTFNLSTGLSALQILYQGNTPIASQTADQLTLCFRRTLLLTHKLGIACAIEMAIEGEE